MNADLISFFSDFVCVIVVYCVLTCCCVLGGLLALLLVSHTHLLFLDIQNIDAKSH